MASHATRASGSLARMASRMASEIWSASLSGWPSATDSEVNRVDTAGPPLNLPRRQGRAAVWALPQAPGFSPWDGLSLAERQVVDSRVAEQLRAAPAQEVGHRRPRRLDHRLDMLTLHDPRRRGRGDRTEDDDPRPLTETLVVAEHLVVQRQLEGAGDELRDVGRRLLVLASPHQADGEDVLRAVFDRGVERSVVDHSPVEVLPLVDPHGREQTRDRGRRQQGWCQVSGPKHRRLAGVHVRGHDGERHAKLLEGGLAG